MWRAQLRGLVQQLPDALCPLLDCLTHTRERAATAACLPLQAERKPSRRPHACCPITNATRRRQCAGRPRLPCPPASSAPCAPCRRSPARRPPPAPRPSGLGACAHPPRTRPPPACACIGTCVHFRRPRAMGSPKLPPAAILRCPRATRLYVGSTPSAVNRPSLATLQIVGLCSAILSNHGESAKAMHRPRQRCAHIAAA